MCSDEKERGEEDTHTRDVVTTSSGHSDMVWANRGHSCVL